MFQMVRLSLEPWSPEEETGSCERYTAGDHDRFTQGLMPPLESEEFMIHCYDPESERSCLTCLRAVKERYENEALLQRTMHLMKSLEASHWTTRSCNEDFVSKNRIHIELAVSGNSLKVIETTGDYKGLKCSKQPHSTRQELPGLKHPVRIAQQFGDPPVSLIASLRIGRIPNLIRMSVAIKNTESQKFVPKVETTLQGTNTRETSFSDKNGQVHFTIPAVGNYRVELVPEMNRLVVLTLSINR